MRTDRLARNDLQSDVYEWYLRYLDAMDRKDLAAYAANLADDCLMFMNNAGPIVGKPAIVGMLGPYWESFGALEHDLLVILGDTRCFMLEALNHYTRLDGAKVTARAVAITERNAAGLVCGVRVYTDPAPVFAPASAE
jgi:ketosteroid isomerase-like protein